ncbi:MAG: hypothetical protein CMJ32_11975 [Phycisphaerae bacterium]|nr:hypothetical protein [Phycisphaerae bacterium]
MVEVESAGATAPSLGRIVRSIQNRGQSSPLTDAIMMLWMGRFLLHQDSAHMEMAHVLDFD